MVKSIRFLKCQITKAEKRANAMEEHSVYSLRRFLAELEKDYEDFKAHFLSDEEEDLNVKEFEEYEEKYTRALALFQEEIDKRLERNPADFLNSTGTMDNKIMVSILDRQQELNETIGRFVQGMPKMSENRLPALKIPHFSGNCRDWYRFKSIFSNRVDKNTSLSTIEKFGHLMSLVEGEASSLVKNLPFIDASYAKAWSILQTKYDKPHKIANYLISDLWKIQTITSKHGFRAFFNTFKETMSALDSFGGFCERRDPWIIHMAVSKFDKRLQEKWAHKLASEEPSLDLLNEFLEEEDDASDSIQTSDVSDREKTSKFTHTNSMCSKFSKVNATFSASCFACGQSHRIFECEKFKSMPVGNRLDLVKSKNRCLNCFGLGHFVSKCNAKGKCTKCGKNHHTLLHIFSNKMGEPSGSQNSVQGDLRAQSVEETLVKVNVSSNPGVESVILPTAVIEVLGNESKFFRCRALLDSGSQASFVTEECIRRLNVNRSKLGVTYETMSSASTMKSKGSIHSIFRSIHCHDNIYSSTLNVINHITGLLPSNYSSLSSKVELESKFQLADPKFDIPAGIDILLGADILFEIIKSQKYYQKVDKLWILESSLGWLLSGGSSSKPSAVKVNCSFSRESDRLDELVKKFWDIEDANPFSEEKKDDVYCENHFSSTTRRLSNGRFSVSLPFRQENYILGDSLRLSTNCFRSLEKRFQADEWYKTEYFKLIEHFKTEGFIEKVQSNSVSAVGRMFYLPHHGVGKKDTKLRIVFDASMKGENGLSLNDVLLPGPNLLPDLKVLLTEFRSYRYVFTADITKMYRQIFVNRDSRDVQRFLWRDGQGADIEEYTNNTVTDGFPCSPFLALRTMKQLAEEEKLNFPRGAKYLSKRYMDDFFIGHHSLVELKETKLQLIGILKSACMRLSKWCSNSEELLSDIPVEDRAIQTEVQIKADRIIKTLGVSWCFGEDCFTYGFELKPLLQSTKRLLISDLAKIFDPLGWITPFTVALKLIFQETCIRKLEWDEDLPDDILSRWKELRSQIESLGSLRISRWIGSGGNIEIHGFCDASTKAYASVIYSRRFDVNGKPNVRIIMAKSRIAPIKPITIARLELCAAHLLAKSMPGVVDSMRMFNLSVCCWTDSTTVLAWLAAHPSKWKSFVANRCGEIHGLLPNVSWKYVRSVNNPADVASRGTTPHLLRKNNLWWDGPFNLQSFAEENIGAPVETEENRELKRDKCFVVAKLDFWDSFCAKFSSFGRLIRVFAYVLRFLRPRQKHRSFEICSEELHTSLEVMIRMVQSQAFFKELNSLNMHKNVSRKSQLSSLDTFLDENGVLRSGGRLSNAPLNYLTKYPIILPKCHLVMVMIRYYHKKYYHADRKLLMALLRQKFWIFRMQSEVKHVIRNCIDCVEGVTYSPKMGSLPNFRLKPAKPFLITGIDFAGPIVLRPYRGRGKLSVKAYIAIMVCMVTKALHLEIVFGLDVESLVNALRRFLARRGRCEKLLSDRGTNFIGLGMKLLTLKKDILSLVDGVEIRQFLTEQLMNWEFIPPASPHMGGLWESGVRSVKTLLSTKFGSITPTIEEMSTALAEVEALLNSRPLFAITQENDGVEIVTPSHLICGYTCSVLPEFINGKSEEVGISLSKRYSYMRNILRSFWNEWSKNYACQLRKIHKWKTDGKPPRKNDVVIVRRGNLPPSCWPMGIIVEVCPGKDGIIRVVRVKYKGAVKTEATRNLVPLLIEA